MTTPIDTPDPNTTEVVPIPCRLCGKAMGIVLPNEGEEFREQLERAARASAVHDGCKEMAIAKRKADEALAAHGAMLEKWLETCPQEFRKPLDPKSKGFNPNRLDRVMDWTYGENGLFLVGPSGRCKTRFAYQLLFREHTAGRKVGAIAHADLRAQCSSLGAYDSTALVRYCGNLARLEVLLLDDLGKGRPTPAAEEAFFGIVDARARECLPTIYTLNGDLQTVVAQFSENYRAPLLRRIQEKTTRIEF